MMLACLPKSAPPAPWASTYDATAEGMAHVIQDPAERPLYEGADGRERTAALLVSLAWFESTFKPGAVGDCGADGEKPRACKPGELGRSHGLFQVQGAGDLTDTRAATRAALVLLRQSFKACKKRPPSEWLGWYAAGGNDCDRGLSESRHRFQKAQWLFLHVAREEMKAEMKAKASGL